MLIDFAGCDLEFTIADNDLHDRYLERWISELSQRGYQLPLRVAGYGGLRRLKHRDCAESIVYFAFLNLEAIGDGSIGSDGTVGSPDIHGSRAYVFYEPRRNPLSIYKLSQCKGILFQNPLPHWGLESTIVVEAKEPHYLDTTFTFITHKATEDGRPLLVLVPNYVLGAENPLISFVLAGGEWGSAYPDRVATYAASAQQAELLGSLRILTLGELARDMQLEYPFFYGRWKSMVFAVFFDCGEAVSFVCNPILTETWGMSAWDIQFTLKDPRPYNVYTFNARLLLKPFAGREDVLQEYLGWRQSEPIRC